MQKRVGIRDKIILCEIMIDACFVLDHYAELDF